MASPEEILNLVETENKNNKNTEEKTESEEEKTEGDPD